MHLVQQKSQVRRKSSPKVFFRFFHQKVNLDLTKRMKKLKAPKAVIGLMKPDGIATCAGTGVLIAKLLKSMGI